MKDSFVRRLGIATCLVAAIVSITAVLAIGRTAKAATGFTVSGKNLKDANGNNFLIRGVSNPHIWFDTDAYNALPNLAAKKCNTIRIVWSTSGSASRLDQIMTRCEQLGMVPMPEVHDATGGTTSSSLSSCASYWARSDVAAVLKNHARDVLINIANEWGGNGVTDANWRDAYESAISIIRNAGITTTLVCDGPGWGQTASAGETYGQTLLNYDPQHNLLFSIHMYSVYNNSSSISSAMSSFSSKNLPLVVGEFGWNYNNGNNNLGCTVNDTLLMQYAQQYGYGYLAWSTKGNDSSNAWLDLTTDWNTPTSPWGNDVFNSTYGIGNTAQQASIFGSSGGGSLANGTYKIVNRLSGLALDAYNNGTADGTMVVQWSYGGGNNQRWNVTSLGGGLYSIVNANANKPLDAANSGGSGTWTDLWTSNSGANQKWQVSATSGGYYKISPSYNTGLALDDYGASTSNYNSSNNNGRIDVWTSSGGTNQQWAFQAP